MSNYFSHQNIKNGNFALSAWTIHVFMHSLLLEKIFERSLIDTDETKHQ